jgi:L-ascorbate peroxidase
MWYPGFKVCFKFNLYRRYVTAVKTTGGPAVEYRPGRPDARLPVDCTPDGRLPGADKKRDHLRDIFYRMGFDDREIVALSGAHTLGRAHPDRSGFDGAWTEEPLKFSNDYFALLVGGGKAGLLQLETDLALLQSPDMEGHVKRYAEDKEAFFSEYAAAHQKLSELGVIWPGSESESGGDESEVGLCTLNQVDP